MSRFLAGLVLAATVLLTMAPAASAETRSLKLYFLHTGERAEITYKRNGRFVRSGLDQVNKILRDWRRNEPGNMDPRLLDLLWAVYRASGSRDYIHVVSAYRSPATNAMLRSRSSGVAQNSQHTHGKAIDFFLPDVNLTKLRNIALQMHGGGVGYYPRSGSPFVHLDVGSVRHWPRMSRRDLASVFPDGQTLHVPTDGKPMPGYQQALAAYQSRQRSGGSIQVAEESRGRSRGLLARLFGGGADEEEDNQLAAAPTPARAVAQQPQATQRQQQAQQPQQPQPETPATILAALPERALPVPRAAPRPSAEVGADLPAEAPALAAGTEEDEVPAASQMAMNVPLPSRRPDRPQPDPVAVRVAEAENEDDGQVSLMTTAFVTPTPRPEPPRRGDPIAEVLSAYKENRESEAVAASEPQVAALPAALAPQEAPAEQSEARPLAAVIDASAREADAEAAPQKASLAAVPSLPSLQAFSAEPVGAKTVRKGARPGVADMRPRRQPVVLPVDTTSARFVLSRESVMNRAEAAERPAFSPQFAAAPKAVYTDGFQQQDTVADARRFTGKAVTFLSVAKFDRK